MKYEVEDKVIIREDLVVGERYGKDIVVEDMKIHLGKQATITHVSSFDDSSFKVDIDNGAWWWTAEMLEPVGEEPITTPNTLTIDMDKLSDKDKELVKSIVDKLENPFDIPTEEHTYYYITSSGDIVDEQWTGVDFEMKCYMLGNYFLTKQEAEFEVEKRKILRKLEILSKKAGGVDWEDNDTRKYCIEYSAISRDMYFDDRWTYRTQGVIYFPTKESCQQAINLVGEDNIKKYIFGVED